MGFKRLIRDVVLGPAVHIVEGAIEEQSLVDGTKKAVKEMITEDNPITKAIYDSGTYDGKKKGYVEASNEYEEKLLKQADEFIKQTKIYEHEKDAYNNLLDEYEQEIDELSNKVDKTEQENELLKELLLKERELKKLV